MSEYKINPYEAQMKALTQMAKDQGLAQQRKAEAGTQAQMMRHLGGFADIASAPVITQSEIMAKQTPKAPGLGRGWEQAAQGIEKGGADVYSGLIDKYKMGNQLASTMGKYEELKRRKDLVGLEKSLMEARVKEATSKPEDTKAYKMMMLKQGITSKKDLKKDKWRIVSKREKVDKEFRPFERLYGSIQTFRKKFKEGRLNPQDRVQLIRLLVPLTEINPGVVREGEVRMVEAQAPIQNQIKAFFHGNVTGEKITDEIVADMFDTASTLRPVAANIKVDALSKLKAQIDDIGLSDKAEVILGKHNLSLMSDPSIFAQFGIDKPSEKLEGPTPSNMSEGDIDKEIEKYQKLIQYKKLIKGSK